MNYALKRKAKVCQHIRSCHRVEARVAIEAVGAGLVDQSAGLAIAVGFILFVENIVDGAAHADGLHMRQLKGVCQVEVAHEVWVEAIVLIFKIVEILAAHILRSELSGKSFQIECQHAVADK